MLQEQRRGARRISHVRAHTCAAAVCCCRQAGAEHRARQAALYVTAQNNSARAAKSAGEDQPRYKIKRKRCTKDNVYKRYMVEKMYKIKDLDLKR